MDTNENDKSFDKMQLFAKIGEDDLHTINAKGLKFVYKKRLVCDDLEDYEDATDEIEIKSPDGSKETKRIANIGKSVICKFRNFVKVPYTKDELKQFTGLDKEWKDYRRQEKDLLFSQMNRELYDILLPEIDKINGTQKKTS